MFGEEQQSSIDGLHSQYLSTTRNTIDVTDARKRTAFAIIRKKSLFGYLYYLEKREVGDSLSGQLALYGGTCEKDDTSFEDALVREIKQELGVKVAQTDLTPQHTLLTNRENKEKMLSAVWRLDVSDEYKHSFSLKKLKKSARKAREALPEDERSKVGTPIAIRFFFGRWISVKWESLTPLTAYCLLMDRL